jgi:hypothetical protein
VRGYVVAAAALALAACQPTQQAPRTSRVEAQAVPLNPTDPRQDRVGDFVFAGALSLSSPDTRLLGGLSDLKVAGDGTFIAVSDEGPLLTGHLVLDNAGRLTGVDRVRLTLLTGPDGRPLASKTEADAEGVARWPNGDVMVSFEHHHRIWLYPGGGGRPRPVPMPQVPLAPNDGMEALALAPKEGADAYWVGIEPGKVFLCRLHAACERAPFKPPTPGRHGLSALYETADGALASVHRRWDEATGSQVVVTLFDPADGQARAQMRLAPPLTVDNVEGVSVVERAGGVKRFYLITDNNFSRRQRTLLMAFDWTPPKPASAP